jgi:hypothetical protein
LIMFCWCAARGMTARCSMRMRFQLRYQGPWMMAG